jgi:hypothetical protein
MAYDNYYDPMSGYLTAKIRHFTVIGAIQETVAVTSFQQKHHGVGVEGAALVNALGTATAAPFCNASVSQSGEALTAASGGAPLLPPGPRLAPPHTCRRNALDVGAVIEGAAPAPVTVGLRGLPVNAAAAPTSAHATDGVARSWR